MYWLPLLLPHLSSSFTDSLPSLNLLCPSKIHSWFMQDGQKAVWIIPYISVAFFQSLKQNFIAYRSSKVSDGIFYIHQLWQSGFSRVYSNCCCSSSFEPEIIKIGQSSHKMYSNNILNFQESMTILNACTKKSGNLLNAPRIHIYIYIYMFVCVCVCVCVCACVCIYISIYFYHIYIYIYINRILLNALMWPVPRRKNTNYAIPRPWKIIQSEIWFNS